MCNIVHPCIKKGEVRYTGLFYIHEYVLLVFSKKLSSAMFFMCYGCPLTTYILQDLYF